MTLPSPVKMPSLTKQGHQLDGIKHKIDFLLDSGVLSENSGPKARKSEQT